MWWQKDGLNQAYQDQALYLVLVVMREGESALILTECQALKSAVIGKYCEKGDHFVSEVAVTLIFPGEEWN